MKKYSQEEIDQEKERIAKFYQTFGLMDMANIIRSSIGKEFNGSVSFLWRTARELRDKVKFFQNGTVEPASLCQITEKDYLDRIDSYYKKPVSPFCPRTLLEHAITLENLVSAYFSENQVTLQNVMGRYNLYAELLRQLEYLCCSTAEISRIHRILSAKPQVEERYRQHLSSLLLRFYKTRDKIYALLAQSEPEFSRKTPARKGSSQGIRLQLDKQNV